MKQLEIITYSPLHLKHTGLALASLQAGGIPIFDVSFCPISELAKAEKNLCAFKQQLPSDARFGLKIPLPQLQAFQSLIQQLEHKQHLLVISNLPTEQGNKTVLPMASIPKKIQLWAEATHIRQKKMDQPTTRVFRYYSERE